ncbi:hypothetical protein V8E53_011369 [Lactarius tabidus]
MSHATKPVMKHQEFFFSDGDITIMFRIDKHHLTRGSRHFRSILNPIVPCRDPPGSSETNPIELDDATSEEFSSLLWVFYNYDYCYKAPLEKWKHILTLARKWGLARVEKLCIRELQDLQIEPVDKIELYQRFNLNPNLLKSSFVEITMRPDPLTIEEGQRLEISTSMRLARARERARDPGLAIRLQPSEVQLVVEEVFGLQGSTPPSTPPLQKHNTTTDDHTDKGGKGRNKIICSDWVLVSGFLVVFILSYIFIDVTCESCFCA